MDQNWALFLGRFHPLIVHLPIGIIILGLVAETLNLLQRFDLSPATRRLIWLLGAASAIASCLIGLLLASDGGYDETLLLKHRNQGFWVAGLCSLLYVSSLEKVVSQAEWLSFLKWPLQIASIFYLSLAGHNGGSLTHGEDFLTAETPQPFRAWLGLPPQVESTAASEKITDINQAKVYNQLIRPILVKNCEACHNDKKAKGELKLHTPEMIMKGGENGPVVIAGNAAESKLLQNILLPLEDDDHMPPKGKPQPSPQDLEILKWWIEQGATFDKKVAEVPVSPAAAAALAKMGHTVSAKSIAADSTKGQKVQEVVFENENRIITTKIDKAAETDLQKIRKLGGLASPISEESNWLDINFINYKSFNDKDLSLLSPISKNIIWLKCNNTQISDQGLKTIAAMPNLTRLNLAYTGVSDLGLSYLKDIKNLEYLNLVGTKVTDAGLKNLAACKSLKKVYLWQTPATAAVQSALPNVQIDFGLSKEKVQEFLKTAASVKTNYKPATDD